MKMILMWDKGYGDGTGDGRGGAPVCRFEI